MQLTMINRIQFGLITAAVLLSALNGLGNLWWAPLWFGSPESTTLRVASVISALLWIPALACAKFPRAGLLVFFALLGIASILKDDPVHHAGSGWARWMVSADYLQLAVIGGMLLLLNLVLVSKKQNAI